MSGAGITRLGPATTGYRCVLSKSSAQLKALGAIATKTYSFGPFPAGCYLLGGYLEIPTAFDVGLNPTIAIGTSSDPLCCVDATLAATVSPTSFNYVPALGGINPSANVSGDTVTVTVAVTPGNFTSFTTGNFNAVILVSAPMQTVAVS